MDEISAAIRTELLIPINVEFTTEDLPEPRYIPCAPLWSDLPFCTFNDLKETIKQYYVPRHADARALLSKIKRLRKVNKDVLNRILIDIEHYEIPDQLACLVVLQQRYKDLKGKSMSEDMMKSEKWEEIFRRVGKVLFPEFKVGE